jgi:hypothetical protein
MRKMNSYGQIPTWGIATSILLNLSVCIPAHSADPSGDLSKNSKLYCGTFHWSGKMASDAIWIEDRNFNISIDNESTKNYLKYYSPTGGLQGHNDGDCICVKAEIDKVPVEQTSGDKGWLAKRLDGIFTCKGHSKVL